MEQVWEDSFVEEVGSLILAGAVTDSALSRLYNVTPKTIGKWRKIHPEFNTAINRAKRQILVQTSASMLRRAQTTTLTQQKVMPDGSIIEYQTQVAGDVRAQERILKSIGRGVFESDNVWDDKSRIELSGNAENPLAFILQSLATEAEESSALPNKQ